MSAVRPVLPPARVLRGVLGVFGALVLLTGLLLPRPAYAATPSVVLASGTGAVGEWLKVDLAGFAPGPAAQALLSREAFRAAVCSGGTAWVIGAAGQEAAFPFLAAAAQVATNGDVRLWKVDGSAPAVRSACAGTPNGGLPRTSPPPRPAARPPAPPDS